MILDRRGHHSSANRRMAEPLDMTGPCIVELANIFAGLTDEEKEEIVAAARWKAERKRR